MKCMKDIELFSSLNQEEKKKVASMAKPKKYAKGEYVFLEGDPADAIYLICAGKIRLFKLSSVGREITIDILDNDCVIGENSIFDDLHYGYNAEALEDSFICACYRNDFQYLLMDPNISMKMIKDLIEKINNFTDTLVNTTTNNAKNRILNIIKKLAIQYGHQTQEGIKIEIKLTHEDIANIAFCSRVTATNVINQLIQEEKVKMTNRYLVFCDEL